MNAAFTLTVLAFMSRLYLESFDKSYEITKRIVFISTFLIYNNLCWK
jgi:hypothetical protein